MADKNVNVKVNWDGKDAEKGAENLQKDVGGIGTSAQNSSSQMTKFAGDMIKKVGGITASIVAVKKAFDFTVEYAKFKQSSDAMSKQFGKNAEEVITQLNKVSSGTISNSNLVQAANRAMALGVTTDVGKMSKLLEYARLRAQAMGTDTTDAFNDIVTGIGRGSPMILDNLGIITTGWEEEAKAVGVAYDKNFILQKVLENASGELSKNGDMTVTVAEQFQQYNAEIQNVKESLGEVLAPTLSIVLSILADTAAQFSRASTGTKTLAISIGIMIPVAIALQAALGPIGIALAAIGAAAIGIKVASDNMNSLNNQVAQTKEELELSKKGFESYKQEIEDTANGVSSLRKKSTNELKKILADLEKDTTGYHDSERKKVKQVLDERKSLEKAAKDQSLKIEKERVEARKKFDTEYGTFYKNRLTVELENAKANDLAIKNSTVATAEEKKKAHQEYIDRVAKITGEYKSLGIKTEEELTAITKEELENREKAIEKTRKVEADKLANMVSATSGSTTSGSTTSTSTGAVSASEVGAQISGVASELSGIIDNLFGEVSDYYEKIIDDTGKLGSAITAIVVSNGADIKAWFAASAAVIDIVKESILEFTKSVGELSATDVKKETDKIEYAEKIELEYAQRKIDRINKEKEAKLKALEETQEAERDALTEKQELELEAFELSSAYTQLTDAEDAAAYRKMTNSEKKKYDLKKQYEEEKAALLKKQADEQTALEQQQADDKQAIEDAQDARLKAAQNEKLKIEIGIALAKAKLDRSEALASIRKEYWAPWDSDKRKEEESRVNALYDEIDEMINSTPTYASGVTDFAGGIAKVHAGEMLVNMPKGTDVIPAALSANAFPILDQLEAFKSAMMNSQNVTNNNGSAFTLNGVTINLPSVTNGNNFFDEMQKYLRENQGIA